MNTFTKKNIFKITIYISLFIIGVIIFLLTSLFIYQNRQAILNITSPKSEPFTELYFQNITNLPVKNIIQANKFLNLVNSPPISYSFQFTIHNLENKNMNYSYEVYSIGNEKTSIDVRNVFIKSNDKKTISEIFSLSKIYPKTKIVINLINKNQQIAFWMEEKLQ